MDNLTAYDTFNEDTFEGPTNVEVDRTFFDTFEEAEEYYLRMKASYRWSGSRGMYVSFPQEVV